MMTKVFPRTVFPGGNKPCEPTAGLLSPPLAGKAPVPRKGVDFLAYLVVGNNQMLSTAVLPVKR